MGSKALANTVENKYAPDWVSPPGETLADILKERKITRSEFVQRMELPKKTINQLIKGKVKITIRIAYKIELALWTPSARFWIERERLYREFLANQIN
ncbi:XRE-family like protein [uncultured phage]|nr:XRE-family like protein [uncultured phage]